MKVARLCFAFIALGLSALAASPALAQSPATHQHHFGDAERWARVFDDPKRDAWQRPDEVIAALKLNENDVVSDIGAGTGYFAVRLARAVPKGRVYAVDLQPDMVNHLRKRAHHEGLANLQAVEASPDDARLPQSVDVVLMVNTYHHIEEREAYFRQLARSLKPGGRLALIDFRPDAPIGPPKATRISEEQALAELKAAGYSVIERHGFLPHQYFVVLRPAAVGTTKAP